VELRNLKLRNRKPCFDVQFRNLKFRNF